jgi:hypothetical protein
MVTSADAKPDLAFLVERYLPQVEVSGLPASVARTARD